jgi:hypothetical protein
MFVDEAYDLAVQCPPAPTSRYVLTWLRQQYADDAGTRSNNHFVYEMQVFLLSAACSRLVVCFAMTSFEVNTIMPGIDAAYEFHATIYGYIPNCLVIN